MQLALKVVLCTGLLLGTGVLKSIWRYSSGIKELLAKYYTLVTCDIWGLATPLSRHYVAEDSDVFVNTFGRSGTMFMMNMLHQLRTGGDERFTAVEQLGRFFVPFSNIGLEKLSLPQFGAPPRIFFSHGLPMQTPKVNYTIYIQRNPERIVHSWYLFAIQIFGMQHKISVEEMYFNCIRKHCFWPQDALFIHIAHWWKAARSRNVLWLRFEDFKKNDEATLRLLHQLINFLDPLIKEKNLTKVFEISKFQFSQSHAHMFDLHTHNDNIAQKLHVCAPHLKSNYVRAVKSSHDLNVSMPISANVKRHLRHSWWKTVFPVTGDDTYFKCGR